MGRACHQLRRGTCGSVTCHCSLPALADFQSLSQEPFPWSSAGVRLICYSSFKYVRLGQRSLPWVRRLFITCNWNPLSLPFTQGFMPMEIQTLCWARLSPTLSLFFICWSSMGVSSIRVASSPGTVRGVRNCIILGTARHWKGHHSSFCWWPPYPVLPCSSRWMWTGVLSLPVFILNPGPHLTIGLISLDS